MKFPKYKLEFNKKVIFIYKSYAQSKLHPKSDFSLTRARIEAGESEGVVSSSAWTCRPR